MTRHALRLASLAAAAVLAGCAQSGSGSGSGTSAAGDDADTAVILLPTSGAASAMEAGCWATFFGERNFNGDSLTLIGPSNLQTFDKGTAKQLKRDIKSIATGPRATLVLYEKQFLSARSVGFEPGSREPGLAEKLGYGGRVESLTLSCR